MRSDVLQVFATCVSAGPFFAGEVDKAQELFGQHSLYKQVHSLSFERAGAVTREGVMAERVAPWLRRLKSEDVSTLRPLLVAYAPHAPTEPTAAWGIISDGDRGLELWQPVWKARVIGRDDPSPFKVVYTASRFNRWSIVMPPSIPEASLSLARGLEAAMQFCETHGDRLVRHAIRQYSEAHHTNRTEVPGMPDLIPDSMDTNAAALAASAARICTFITSSQWTALAHLNKPKADAIYGDLWKSAMQALESAAYAPAQVLRKTA